MWGATVTPIPAGQSNWNSTGSPKNPIRKLNSSTQIMFDNDTLWLPTILDGCFVLAKMKFTVQITKTQVTWNIALLRDSVGNLPWATG